MILIKYFNLNTSVMQLLSCFALLVKAVKTLILKFKMKYN